MDKITEPAKLKAATTYNAAADHFDDGPLAFWDRYGRKTIERLPLKPGSIVLDVGCGSGASAIPAAKAVGPHGRVIGADLAERLLVMAQAKADASQPVRPPSVPALTHEEWLAKLRKEGWTLPLPPAQPSG
jgi:ubiquinone/menaquinone biosynthesis C-methylase UbiE